VIVLCDRLEPELLLIVTVTVDGVVPEVAESVIQGAWAVAVHWSGVLPPDEILKSTWIGR
jgi:hypothetical protein